MADLPLHRHDRDVEIPWARARIDALLAAGARSILDVGCVDGFVLDEYAQAVGIDLRVPPDCWYGRVGKYDVATLDELPRTMEDGFDIVTCISTVEHVGLGFYGDPTVHGEDGPALAFRSLVRLTAPGGHILLTVPIGLTRQEGAGAARYWTIEERDVWGWAFEADLVTLEWLIVSGHPQIWTGYPDPAGHTRRVLLAVLKKKEA